MGPDVGVVPLGVALDVAFVVALVLGVGVAFVVALVVALVVAMLVIKDGLLVTGPEAVVSMNGFPVTMEMPTGP